MGCMLLWVFADNFKDNRQGAGSSPLPPEWIWTRWVRKAVAACLDPPIEDDDDVLDPAWWQEQYENTHGHMFWGGARQNCFQP